MEREILISVVSAAQSGDGDALNKLFNAYYNDVYYFALKTVKDSELACDITQETFVKIIGALGDLKEPAAFVTWMKQITYSLCTGYFKKKKDVLVDETEDGGTIFDTLQEDRAEFIPDEAMDQQDFRRTILAMLDTLSPEQRSATMLYYYDELSIKEVAQIQGVSEGTVKSRLNYARKAIKAAVEDYEKKNNIKLHSVGLFSLIPWLFAGSGGAAMPAAAAAAVAAGVSAATGVTIALTGAVSGGLLAGTGIFATIASMPLATKITAAAVAGVLLLGGAGIRAATKAEALPVLGTGSTIQETTDVTAPTHADSDMTFPPESTGEHRPVPIVKPAGGDSGKNETEETTEATTEQTQPEETTVPTTAPTTEPSAEPTTEPTTEPSVEPTTQPTTEPAQTAQTVPAGCTYITADGTTLQSGDPMPESVSDGDRFVTADYTYLYTYGVETSYTTMGWVPAVNDQTKSSYEALQSQINGAPVVSLAFTFMGCSNMTAAPAIPYGVMTLDRAFHGCRALTQAPAIPASVGNMSQAFAFCSSLQTPPVIPAGVTNLWQAFYGCESLTAAPAIPSGVTNLYQTFSYCLSLQTAPSIPAGVYNMEGTFSQCWSLTAAPALPAGLTIMQNTFAGCSSLSQAPAIPASVTNMMGAFSDCRALTGTVVIDANPTTYMGCFAGTQNPITLSGSSTVLGELAATASGGNVTAP